MTFDSQNARILSHLENGGTLTQRDAIRLFKCYRLSGRIHDLRCRGFDIITEDVKHIGKRFARYSIV